jgi:hypothetical protein
MNRCRRKGRLQPDNRREVERAPPRQKSPRSRAQAPADPPEVKYPPGSATSRDARKSWLHSLPGRARA